MECIVDRNEQGEITNVKIPISSEYTDIYNNKHILNKKNIIEYDSEVGKILYIKDSKNNLIMLKERIQQDMEISSLTYTLLTQQPFITKEQALEIYKEVYSDKLNGWQDIQELEC